MNSSTPANQTFELSNPLAAAGIALPVPPGFASNYPHSPTIGVNANQLAYMGSYTVKNPFLAMTTEQLTVMPGEVVSVLAVHGGGDWLLVKNNFDQVGMVPKINVMGMQ